MVPVLEEVVADQSGVLLVPLSPIEQRDEAEEPELPDRDVGHPGGFRALLALDPHAHVRRQDHVHVIRPVPDGQREF